MGGLLAIKLKTLSCGQSEYLLKENNYCRRSIFIQRTGTALISSPFDKNECVISKMGTIFGFNSFIKPQSQRRCSVKTLSYSEFYVLDYDDIENVLQSHVENVDYFLNLIKKRIQTLYQNKIIILQIDELNDKYNNSNQSNTKQIFSNCFDGNDQMRNEKIMKGRGSIDFDKEMDCMKRENKNKRNSFNTCNQPKRSDVSIEHCEQQKSETAENIQEQNTNQEI